MFKVFAKLFLFACVVAIPLSYMFANNWLANFAIHVDLSIWIFIEALFFIILITGLTVGYESIKAAMMNPIDSLKSE